MRAFHNEESIKQKYINRVLAHQKADEIVKGQYWGEGKGCAVGCTIHGSDHSAYERELGIPEWMARLEDTLFENLPNESAKLWPAEFLEAVNVGADLEKIKTPFLIFILEKNLEYMAGAKYDVEKRPEVKNALDGSAAAVKQMIEAHKSGSEADLSAARSAAESAAWSARSAAESAAWSAWSAAESAAWSAWSAARSAAWSAWSARSAAESAAWSAAFETYADKLLDLIRECKP
jgi:hypothetical protein